MLVRGRMSARFCVLTRGRRTSYQPCPGSDPSHASTALIVSIRGSKPMFWQTLKTSWAFSSATLARSSVTITFGVT